MGQRMENVLKWSSSARIKVLREEGTGEEETSVAHSHGVDAQYHVVYLLLVCWTTYQFHLVGEDKIVIMIRSMTGLAYFFIRTGDRHRLLFFAVS